MVPAHSPLTILSKKVACWAGLPCWASMSMASWVSSGSWENPRQAEAIIFLHHDRDQPREPAPAELGGERDRPPAGLDVLLVRLLEPGRGRDVAVAVQGAALDVADPVERGHHLAMNWPLSSITPSTVPGSA
jgi:hypothetical protein